MTFETLERLYVRVIAKLASEEEHIDIQDDPISQWGREGDGLTLQKSIGRMAIRDIIALQFDELSTIQGMGETHRFTVCILLERAATQECKLSRANQASTDSPGDGPEADWSGGGRTAGYQGLYAQRFQHSSPTT